MIQPSAPELVNTLLDRLGDWEKRPSKASTKRLDDALRAVLTVMLGRTPTEDEMKEACQ